MSNFFKAFSKLLSLGKTQTCKAPEIVFSFQDNFEFKVVPVEKVPKTQLLTGATDSTIKVVLDEDLPHFRSRFDLKPIKNRKLF